MKRKLLRILAGAVALTGVASALLTGNAHAAEVQLQVRLENLNGLCLTATNAATGSVPVQTGCADAHAFTWDVTHDNIFVQGHPGQCLVASDLLIIIGPCSGANSSLAFGATDGDFQQVLFKNEANSFWHANGNGDAVSLIGNPGSSLAVYWDCVAAS
jgi:hypothetical protein